MSTKMSTTTLAGPRVKPRTQAVAARLHHPRQGARLAHEGRARGQLDQAEFIEGVLRR